MKHTGLRISVIGAVICLISLPLLSALPKELPSAGIVIGGAMVWLGLMWTIFGYYNTPHEPMPPR
jgi:hypothetical protein